MMILNRQLSVDGKQDGFVGSASGHPAYHASKGAVRIYSKAAAVRYGPSGVRVRHRAPRLYAADA